jgi:chloramphenicol O-acetyltransferase type A
MKEIDLSAWKRKEHYAFFSRMDYPQFNICFDLNITHLLSVIKKEKLSFYYTLIYLSTISANEVEEFKYRARDGKVVLHDTLHPAFTDMDADSDLFKMVTVHMSGSLKEFVSAAKEKSLCQKEYFIPADFIGRDDYIYFTSIPWISFTHLSHTISLNKNDSVPRISWGRYYERDSEVLLPFSVQVNHAFADGIHIGRYKEALETNMKRVSEL